MRSAIGNFTPLGERIMADQTPEKIVITISDLRGILHAHDIVSIMTKNPFITGSYEVNADWSLSRITTHGKQSDADFTAPSNATNASSADMANEPRESVTAIGFSTVLTDELRQLTLLCAVMIDNGASLYDLQRRVLGFD